MQVEGFDFLEAGRCLHEFGIALEARMASNLEVVLLLAHVRVVRDAEVEALVGVHAVVDHGQLLQALVEQLVPVLRLESVEPNALAPRRIASLAARSGAGSRA